jgi:hypothetical protein
MSTGSLSSARSSTDRLRNRYGCKESVRVVSSCVRPDVGVMKRLEAPTGRSLATRRNPGASLAWPAVRDGPNPDAKIVRLNKIRSKQAVSKRCWMAVERGGLLWTTKQHLTCDDGYLSTGAADGSRHQRLGS